MAERVGFEPTCRLPDKTLSRRPRYDHFGTSPFGTIAVNRTFYYSVWAPSLSHRGGDRHPPPLGPSTPRASVTVLSPHRMPTALLAAAVTIAAENGKTGATDWEITNP